jgi:hypothetical protein
MTTIEILLGIVLAAIGGLLGWQASWYVISHWLPRSIQCAAHTQASSNQRLVKQQA